VRARFALKVTVDLKHRLAVRHNATSSACGDKNVCAAEQSFIK